MRRLNQARRHGLAQWTERTKLVGMPRKPEKRSGRHARIRHRDKSTVQSAGPAWHAAEQFGCDMSLLEINLNRTPEERIRAHSRALATLTALREAMEKRNARS